MIRPLLILVLGIVGFEATVAAQQSNRPSRASADADQGLLDTAKSLFEQAKQAGTTKADSARQWLSEKLKQSADSSEASAEQTAVWIAEQFQRAKSAGETTADSARDWVLQDVQNMGRWEYTQLTVESSSSATSIAKQMNQLGRDRWECIFVDRQNAMTTFYFKRPVRSYLKHIPARDLMRLVPLLGGSDAGE